MELLFAPARPPDPRLWASLLSPGVHLRVAGRPIAIGRDCSATELALLFQPILWFGAGFQVVLPSPEGETVLVETDIIIASSPTALPIAIIFRLAGPSSPIRDVRFYLDPTLLELPPPSGPTRVDWMPAF